ncbi:aminotransferase class I/II-fold pyridoxal phosphate-dependent enzyme [Xanthomonas translucens pv. graminis]|uniref:pyridoxal phosphate-dependent aminotransferase n=1 Tax=Xanthomonas graminis TaxID=3390026 RepID=UPI002541E9BD|nr:aminotransferase class I/II-fold pyridoxal phosphate-dependent enzyme [Xanthomonas translucens]WIH04879.1 aminotransferase class I/II-fold pyridoxal phosphate-dependent enzyme [Xanthomonas translucens pv. graminis]
MAVPHQGDRHDDDPTLSAGLAALLRRADAIGRVGSCFADELSQQRKREGGDIVPLSGAPRRPPPAHVIEAAQRAMTETGYAQGRGILALRQALATKVAGETGIRVDAEQQIVVTNGAMQALHIIMTGLLAPDEEVIIPSPCYSYDGLVRLAGANPVIVPMRIEDDYAWDMERIRSAITAKTRLLVVNTPTNPTGRVLTMVELTELVRIAQEYDLLLLADEAYDRLVYDGRRHVSIYSIEGAAERTIVVQSATKSYAMGAWRIGWIVAPRTLTTVFARMIEWMMLAVNHIAQAAATAVISGPQDWLADLATEFQSNRDLSVGLLGTIEGISFVVPQGGPFLIPDVSRLGVSGDDFAETLIKAYGLRVSGGSHYHSPKSIRVPYGGTPAAIEETFHRMRHAVTALRA